MKKRQKLLLVLYALAVLWFGFLYVPYTMYYSDCVHRFAGHHFRNAITNFIGIDHWSRATVIATSIDSTMILAELFALTAFAGAAILFFKDKENYQHKMNGPF